MTGLPIRVRVTLAFTGVMAVVLAAIGIAVHLRFEAQLDAAIDQGLRSRADDVRAVVRRDGGALAGDGGALLVEEGESFAQLLTPAGDVLDAPARLKQRPLLSAPQLRDADRRTIIIDRPSPFERGEPARLLATPVDTRSRRLVAVVGVATDDRDDALHNLALLLVLGGVAALALSAAAGYGVAAAALRPVETMRRKAAAITRHGLGERLPEGPRDDELARLGATLNEMLARLETSFERERGFVADAGHELRTPLAILEAELELALRAGRTPDELRDALRSAAEETDRLARLADALLTIARADARGGLALAPTAVTAGELFADVRRRFGPRARSAGRAIVDEGGELRLCVDRERVVQALDGLVDNALRHGAGRIRLRATTSSERVLALHVLDEGPGFPGAFVARAFDRFTRADPARARDGGGSGLGLAIVLAIARAHGGDAGAANDPAGGADVWIELPRC